MAALEMKAFSFRRILRAFGGVVEWQRSVGWDLVLAGGHSHHHQSSESRTPGRNLASGPLTIHVIFFLSVIVSLSNLSHLARDTR